MKPIALLLFAVLARLLWSLPVWWAVVALAGAAGYILVEEWRQRARMKAYKVPSPDTFEEWQPCSARKKIFEGLELRCVKRAGHDGDDSDHLASRDDLSWPGN